MAQKIEALSANDADHVEKQREWVRGHYEDHARHHYDSIEGKLRVLDVILRSNWIEPTETWKLQSLGITFGDVLVQRLGLCWVAVEDETGRDPALQDPGTTTIVFPLTAISKRIERGEEVDVHELVEGFCQQIIEVRAMQKIADKQRGGSAQRS